MSLYMHGLLPIPFAWYNLKQIVFCILLYCLHFLFCFVVYLGLSLLVSLWCAPGLETIFLFFFTGDRFFSASDLFQKPLVLFICWHPFEYLVSCLLVEAWERLIGLLRFVTLPVSLSFASLTAFSALLERPKSFLVNYLLFRCIFHTIIFVLG